MAFRVALTFDAEHPDRPPSADGTARVLDVLQGAGMTATFFVQGRWAEAYPWLVRRMADEGHRIGNHSHFHARMSLLTDAGLETDVREAATAITEAAGVDPQPWFRCPFGDGADDPRVLGGLSRLGYRHVGWHVEGPDWPPGTDGRAMAEEMARAVVACGDGAVVLMHPWTIACGVGLPVLLAALTAAAAAFVTVDQLDRLPGVP